MTTEMSIRRTESIADHLNNLHDQVTKRAFEIWNENGNFGQDLDNWLRAEGELVWKPAIKLEEKDNQILLQIAMPGVEANAINLEVTPEDVLVRADSNHHRSEDEGKVHVCEFTSGVAFRSIHLPRRIDSESAKAEFEDGILSFIANVA